MLFVTLFVTPDFLEYIYSDTIFTVLIPKTKRSLSMNIKLWASAVCLGTIVSQSCVDHYLPEPEVEACTVTVSFADDVNPIINTSCAIPGCHNGDNGADKNWTVFSNFQSNKDDVKDRITRPPGTPGHMPAAGSITAEQIQTIVCWVDQGGQNN
jgi:hypothetical protein